MLIADKARRAKCDAVICLPLVSNHKNYQTFDVWSYCGLAGWRC